MNELVLPRVQAMMICDDCFESHYESGVFHVLGARSAITASSFPMVRPFCVFLHLSGHAGSIECLIRVESSEPGNLVGDTDRRWITFVDPSLTVAEYIRVTNSVFDAPGVYFVQVYNDERLIGERRLYVLEE